jgi:CobQ-like glutamine amidotransferase family enzyme
MTPSLKLCHLYPRRMNIYGDRGNIQTLSRRAEWRGLSLSVDELEIGQSRDLTQYDLFFFGGGQDVEQHAVAADLRPRGAELREAVADGAALLAVCGGYQLLGRSYRPNAHDELEGVGLFNASTVAGPKRLIGNVVAKVMEAGMQTTVVGFENHSGLTTLGADAKPFAYVTRGHGNNGRDKTEGCLTASAIGTYLHGSLLPKNPVVADWLLERAVRRRHPDYQLPPLESAFEEAANRQAVTMFS